MQDLRLDISQKQQQTLAPVQLRYAKMLEMNGAEIEEEVRRELDDNPALELVSDAHESHDDFGESSDQLQLADYASPDDIPSYRLGISNRSADDPYYEPTQWAVASESLYDYLARQLSELDDIDDTRREIALFIIGNLDSNGYLTRSIPAIADDVSIALGIDIAPQSVQLVWDLIRGLDPAGIAAVDLCDCLLLQLARLDPETPYLGLATEIIRDYFDLFSLLHFPKLATLTSRSLDEIKQAVALIKTLNPKPGNAIGNTADDDPRLRHITPDFLIEYDDETHRLSLTLLHRLPQLQVEESFDVDTSGPAPAATRTQRQAQTFIRVRREQAQSFIQILKLRQQTLIAVMKAIMHHQRDFFISGDPLKLRPMVLKDIAAASGYDISVVSRVTMGKYVATHQGVYSLKSLFNEPRRSADDTSRAVVLDKIRQLIEQEDKSHPLSDDELTLALKREGFDIARRTVAKYREMLSLPVARLRKHY